MLIPNVREKYIRRPFQRLDDGEELEINSYYQENLKSETSKAYIRGYDCVAESIIDDFFNNLELYTQELSDEGIWIHSIDAEYINSNEYEINAETIRSQTLETRLVDALKRCLLDYIESERNDIVVSMLDSEYIETEKHGD
jgi:hypothetical protein